MFKGTDGKEDFNRVAVVLFLVICCLFLKNVPFDIFVGFKLSLN